MFGIKATPVLLPHKLTHDSKHIDLTLMNKNLSIFLVWLPDTHIAEVDVVDAISRAEITGNSNRVFAKLSCYTAIERYAVGGTFDNIHQTFPACKCGHDLA